MAWRECPCRTLSMNHQLRILAIHFMLFYLCNVMGNIVNKAHAEFSRRNIENIHKGFFCPVHDTLSVSPGIIGRSPHGSKVILCLRACIRCTGKFFVKKCYLIFDSRTFHDLKKVCAYLMSKTPGTCMNHYSNLVPEKSEDVCGLLIIDLINILNLEKVIARAQGALLCPSSLICLPAYQGWISPFNISTGFYFFQVFGVPESLIYCPFCLIEEHILFIIGAKPY